MGNNLPWSRFRKAPGRPERSSSTCGVNRFTHRRQGTSPRTRSGPARTGPPACR